MFTDFIVYPISQKGNGFLNGQLLLFRIFQPRPEPVEKPVEEIFREILIVGHPLVGLER
jgi:hypothetical protein